MSKVANDQTFDATLKSDKPVLVDFHAKWCGPCKMLGPVLEEVGLELIGKIDVVKVDVDESPEVTGRFGIMSIPTLIVFKDGVPVKQFAGYRDKPGLLDELKSVL